MGATETIAKWIVNTNYEDIPPDAIRVASGSLPLPSSCFAINPPDVRSNARTPEAIAPRARSRGNTRYSTMR